MSRSDGNGSEFAMSNTVRTLPKEMGENKTKNGGKVFRSHNMAFCAEDGRAFTYTQNQF